MNVIEKVKEPGNFLLYIIRRFYLVNLHPRLWFLHLDVQTI